MADQAKAGGKNKKHGRNNTYCKVYLLQGRREINKKKKLRRHIKNHPNDLQVLNNENI